MLTLHVAAPCLPPQPGFDHFEPEIEFKQQPQPCGDAWTALWRRTPAVLHSCSICNLPAQAPVSSAAPRLPPRPGFDQYKPELESEQQPRPCGDAWAALPQPRDVWRLSPELESM